MSFAWHQKVGHLERVRRCCIGPHQWGKLRLSHECQAEGSPEAPPAAGQKLPDDLIFLDSNISLC